MKIIRTKVNDKFLFVHFDESLRDKMNEFIIKVLEAHSVQPKEYEVCLLDQYGTPINSENFSLLIDSFDPTGNFFIEIKLEPTELAIDTPIGIQKKLIAFLNETKMGKKAIDEENKNNKLEVKIRRHVISIAVDFIVELFGIGADAKIIKMTCSELIEIFPSLRCAPSEMGGIDLLYNPSQSSGFIYNAINYRRQKLKTHIEPTATDSASIVDTVDQALQDLSMCEKEYTENEIQEILIYFRTCMVSTEKSALIEKLSQTIDLRNKIIKEDNRDLRELFPFYFVSPDLILTDFALRFKETNDRSLVEKWPFISQRIVGLNEGKYDARYDQIDVNINHIITLFSRIQPRRNVLSKSLKNLIVFNMDSSADPLDLMAKNNDSIHMIVVGSAASNVSYYICLKNSLIPVPKGYTFIETFDMFFKTFKVFCINYHPHINNIMNFFGRFVYKTTETGALYGRLLEVKNAIFNVEENNNVEVVENL